MAPPDKVFLLRREISSADIDAGGIVYTPRTANFTVETVDLWFTEHVRAGAPTVDLQVVLASLYCTFLWPMRAGEILNISLAWRPPRPLSRDMPRPPKVGQGAVERRIGCAGCRKLSASVLIRPPCVASRF